MERDRPRKVLPELTPIRGSKVAKLRNLMQLFNATERRNIERELDEQARSRRRAEADASTLRLG